MERATKEYQRDYTMVLPWPPSQNQLYIPIVRKVQGKIEMKPGKRLSDKGKGYKRDAAMWLLLQRMTNTEIREPVRVHLHVCPPDFRARDDDNLPKIVFDVLTATNVWRDDSLVRDHRVSRGAVVKRGRVFVRIQKLAAEVLALPEWAKPLVEFDSVLERTGNDRTIATG